DTKARADAIRTVLETEIPRLIRERKEPYQRVVLYLAGHGQAEETTHGKLEGWLLASDARRESRDGHVAMRDVRAAIDALAVKHVLVILDCCYAGAFARTRDLAPRRPANQQQYDWHRNYRASQLLVSAAHNQLALDGLASRAHSDSKEHSPFASALLHA